MLRHEGKYARLSCLVGYLLSKHTFRWTTPTVPASVQTHTYAEKHKLFKDVIIIISVIIGGILYFSFVIVEIQSGKVNHSTTRCPETFFQGVEQFKSFLVNEVFSSRHIYKHFSDIGSRFEAWLQHKQVKQAAHAPKSVYVPN